MGFARDDSKARVGKTTEKKYRTDDLQDMLRDVQRSPTFQNVMKANLENQVRMTIMEFLALVAHVMKDYEKQYQ
jgi:hypothetical protein